MILPEGNNVRLLVPGAPMGKPRMTRRDKWQQRPCVLEYRAYCDRMRAVVPAFMAQVDCFALDVTAYLPMPDSWSKKKKASMNGKPHRTKPDADNVLKAVGDALFKDDSGLWDVRCRKYWCLLPAEARTEIIVQFDKPGSS